MPTAVALQHQDRLVTEARPWRANQLAATARLTTLGVRHRRRDVHDEGPGTEVALVRTRPSTAATVARQWSGVLAIFGLIVVVGLVVVILGAWAFGYRPVVVTSGSMEPVVRTGDVVITKPTDVDDDLGDQTVIDFIDPATDERRLHRVIEVTRAGYRTKGDANQSPDPQLVPPDHVRGAGFILAPYVGYVTIWTDRGEWGRLAAAAAVLLALSAMSTRRWMWGTADRRWVSRGEP